MSGSRRLRASRRLPPLRLLELGDAGASGSTTLVLSGRPADPPSLFVRVGSVDLGAALRAVAAGARPAAIVTGLSESRDVTSRARRLTREHQIPWLCDPVLYRTALPGYRTAKHLQDLDYAPGRDADPYTAEEFENPALMRHVARGVVGVQMDVGASGSWAGSFVSSGMQDPWLRVNQQLLQVGISAAQEWSTPVLAGLPVRMMGFETIENQRLFVRALSSSRPAAWVLMLDGLTETSSPRRIVAALRLALALQASGIPVFISRAGALRRLFWAFGIRGAEIGLGRLLRFYVPDYRAGRGGPGPTPLRFETPSLACSLSVSAVWDLLMAEVIAEADCDCPACQAHATLSERLEHVAEHNLHVAMAEALRWAGVLPTERVAQLDRTLSQADHSLRLLELDGVGSGAPGTLGQMRRALDLAVQSGFLEPERVAAELRLFDP
jgi:hypothetical protein